ncbi:hypothetical protein TNIN_419111 [Trichonephila inaurata madagascariensis]|uniref:Fibronectin type-III domain-containing protein n=1 Tax=Trichonephila inaurata madagascariensis TaxID=2747483 RepID=A0A8X7C7H1_9ARAC|nr:hypothetical protein TNIN_419111 [Trichonephila inaurata madagascariensis]
MCSLCGLARQISFVKQDLIKVTEMARQEMNIVIYTIQWNLIRGQQLGEKWHEERSKKVVVSNVDTSATIAGLKPVTTYHIHVTARNAIGQSLPSLRFNCYDQSRR